MQKLPHLLLIAVTLLALTQCQVYNRIFHINIPADVKDIEYSPDQKYSVLAANTIAYVYNGFTAELIRAVTYPQGSTFVSLAFSQDSSTFIIGAKNGVDNLPHFLIYKTLAAS